MLATGTGALGEDGRVCSESCLIYNLSWIVRSRAPALARLILQICLDDGHVPRVAAERFNIQRHPLHHVSNVRETGVLPDHLLNLLGSYWDYAWGQGIVFCVSVCVRV